MSPTPRGRRPAEPADALPPDSDLDALFNNAFPVPGSGGAAGIGPRADRRGAARPLSAVAPVPAVADPAPDPLGSSDTTAFSPAQEVERPGGGPDTPSPAVDTSQVPAERSLPDPAADIVRQSTVLVSFGVAQRFDLYRRQRAALEPRPTNTEVIFRALNSAHGKYADLVTASQPQAEPGQLFGAHVRGRRQTVEARRTTQLSFRPTFGESEMIQQLAQDAGASSMSAFLDVVLDAFLPPLKDRGPARRGPAGS